MRLLVRLLKPWHGGYNGCEEKFVELSWRYLWQMIKELMFQSKVPALSATLQSQHKEQLDHCLRSHGSSSPPNWAVEKKTIADSTLSTRSRPFETSTLFHFLFSQCVRARILWIILHQPNTNVASFKKRMRNCFELANLVLSNDYSKRVFSTFVVQVLCFILVVMLSWNIINVWLCLPSTKWPTQGFNFHFQISEMVFW